MLQLGKWLDVRANPTPSIKEAVSIPMLELPKRVHELPSKQSLIQVASTGSEAREAKDWLKKIGRLADLSDDFEYGESGKFRLWAPNRFLEEALPRVPVGRTLDLACGSGRDAVYMASCGFQVTAVDHLEDALCFGRELAKQYVAQSDSIHWVRTDLEAWLPAGLFDVVTCFFYLNRRLFADISKLLKPGGHLIAETFTAVHRDTFGKPKSERLVLQPGELQDLAVGLDVLQLEEGWDEGRHTARILARRG